MSHPDQQSIKLRAVIYIGASSVSMLINSATTGEEIDFLEQSIPLAHDIFSKDTISKSSIERAVKIIQGYIDNFNEYGKPEPDMLNIVATNILFEASNKDSFLTRLQIACNQPINILDDGEMTRLLYLKTRRRLNDTPVMQKRTTLVVHVGPGNTRAILFRQGKIVNYLSFRLGTHRTAEAIDPLHMQGAALIRVIREHSGAQISALIQAYKDKNIEEIVFIGYEIQNIFTQHLQSNPNKIKIESLRLLSKNLSESTIDDIVKNYPLDYQSAEAALPAIEINLAIAEAFNLTKVHLPGSDFERGLLIDLSNKQAFAEGYEHEVIQSARELATKFQVHEGHSDQVCILCEQLFHSLAEIHQLDKHDLLLLRTAAILHEAGGFIHSKAHHKHSMYLIMHSEIFGLGQDDVDLIALVARYHRNSPPKPSHSVYKDLNTKDQIRVTKLSALLRVADALDRTHSGRIGNIDSVVKRSKLHLTLHDVHDASVERLALANKGNLLEEIFGLEIILNESTH